MPDRKDIPDWLPVIRSDTAVKYTTIVDAIANAIETGSLSEGQRLPPHRELAGLLGVTVATVTKAITDLNRRGLLASRRGSGTYVRGPRSIGIAVEPADGPMDLAINRPAVGPVAAALAQALADVSTAHNDVRLFGYEPVGGSPEHRRAGTIWLAERGIEVADEQIIVTQGANEGLLTALAAVARPGDTVLCEEVNYAGLRRIAHLLGLTLAGVAIDAKGMIPASLEEAARRHEARAVVCTPVTHNPTGATLDAARRRELVRVAQRAGIMLIEDDINGHLGGEETETLFALAPEQTIYVTSMSKCLSAGLRVGFLAASRSMAPRLRDALYATNWTAPSLHAAIAARLITTGAARRCVADQRREASARVGLARRHLGRRVLAEAPAYHVWIPVDRSMRAEELCVDLLKESVIVSPAHHFAVPGGPVPNAIRISLGSVEDRAELETALALVAERLIPQAMVVGAIA
ncbi:PLP-dependent aminotransferase family protein [Microvirga massiliensis]|uniref:aminotransferase-like domain-containing protein n=1 Tax=Microvirga massiliensis TaxID=1033741 RepID=UPI00062B455E|nr:PLP-dependent aminotransferase family protein [Microvirga massiliensis]